MKPRYNAPAFNKIPPIKRKCFGPKKYFHSYLHVDNSENLGLEHNFSQSLEMRYSGVWLYKICKMMIIFENKISISLSNRSVHIKQNASWKGNSLRFALISLVFGSPHLFFLTRCVYFLLKLRWGPDAAQNFFLSFIYLLWYVMAIIRMEEELVLKQIWTLNVDYIIEAEK